MNSNSSARAAAPVAWEHVLLDADLLPVVVRHIDFRSQAAPGVCKAWVSAWAEERQTEELGLRLRAQ